MFYVLTKGKESSAEGFTLTINFQREVIGEFGSKNFLSTVRLIPPTIRAIQVYNMLITYGYN